MTTHAHPPIFAVIVSYQPDESTLIPLLEGYSNQTDHIVIVDNSDKNDNRLLEQVSKANINFDRLSIVRLGDNFGIATALNIGISIAKQEGAEFVVLSDQDSLPASDMVHHLHEAFQALTTKGIKVGGVGPTFTDLFTGLTYPFQAKIPGKFFYGHARPTPEQPLVEAITLITSGTLIPLNALDTVGMMREDFFIDHVDDEWCHRARGLGYHIFGTGLAMMNQRMGGGGNLRVWYRRWRYESAYSPLRIYYRLRNFVALLKMKFIDRRWKIRSSWYMLGIIYSHTIFGPEKLKSLYMALKGIYHGLIGRMGKH